MAHPNFEDDIKPMFANYVGCMRQVVLSDDNGVIPLDLSSYSAVTRFHERIWVAINGYKTGFEAPHPMPPGGPLPDDKIDMFKTWIDGGMPETGTEPGGTA